MYQQYRPRVDFLECGSSFVHIAKPLLDFTHFFLFVTASVLLRSTNSRTVNAFGFVCLMDWGQTVTIKKRCAFFSRHVKTRVDTLSTVSFVVYYQFKEMGCSWKLSARR